MKPAAVLLSASFPGGDRGQEVAPYDVNQIADACVHVARALLRADMTIVFGAHPTISPLVLSLAAERNAKHHVAIHQSRWFDAEIPADTLRLQELGFGDIEWHDQGNDQASSVRAMREAMIPGVDAGVFIGGMSGILEEARIAQEAGARCFALAGPGGAARALSQADGVQVFDGPKYPEIAARIVDEILASATRD